MGRKILLLGIGQTGCAVSEAVLHRIDRDGYGIHALAVDTDDRTLDTIELSTPIAMTHGESLGALVDKLGADNVKKWFPADWEADSSEFVKSLSMRFGSNLWRMKAYLSFVAYISNNNKNEMLCSTLKSIVEQCAEDDAIEMYTVASLAGGTGSAIFLPLALYVKSYISALGGRVASSEAILAMPEIVDGLLSSEQKVKAQANAYAAVRELDAMNKIALAEGEAADRFGCFGISFKLGEKNGTPEVLFNSDDKEHTGKETLPFDKVAMIERVPGVNSVSTSVAMIADSIVSVIRCDGSTDSEKKMKENAVVYSGLSLMKITYPVDSIVKYITSEQLYSYVTDEIVTPHLAANKNKMKTPLAHSSMADSASDDELYSAALLGVARLCDEDHGGVSTMIGRPAKEDEPTDRSPLDASFAKSIIEYVNSTLLCESSDTIKKVRNERFDAEYAEAKKLNKRAKRPSKKKLRARLCEIAADVHDCLEDCYTYGLTELREGTEGFEENLLSPENPNSIINQALMKDGKFLHPAYAMLRLSILAETVRKSYLSRTTKVECEELLPSIYDYFEDVKNAPIKKKVKKAKKSSAANGTETPIITQKSKIESLLSRMPETAGGRFWRFVDPDERGYEAHIYSELDFREDVWTACTSFTSVFRSLRYGHVMQIIDRLMASYRRIIDGLALNSSELRTNVRLALGACTGVSGNVVNVGATETEKKSAFAEYLTIYNNDEKARGLVDERIGEIFCKAVTLGDGNASIDTLAEEMEKIYDECVRGSDFFKESIDKNIWEAATDSIRGRFGYSALTYAKMLKMRFIPIKISSEGFYEGFRQAQTATTVILPKEVEQYIADNSELFSGNTPHQQLASALYEADEHEGRPFFVSGVDRRDIWVRKETFGFPLCIIETFNEVGNDPTAYSSYLGAMDLSRKQLTPMWNPSLIYERCADSSLPLISPMAQKERELAAVRAIVYATATSAISSREIPDVGRVLDCSVGAVSVPMMVDDEYVTDSKMRNLLVYAYRNPAWAHRFAAEYELELKKLEGLKESEKSHGVVAAMIRDSSIIRDIIFGTVKLLSKLHSGRSEGDAIAFSRIAQTISQDLFDFCAGDAIFEERPAAIYNAVIDAFAERLASACAGVKAKNVAERLASMNCFRRIVLPNGFSDISV